MIRLDLYDRFFDCNKDCLFCFVFLTEGYRFEAVVVETAGTFSEGTKNIVREIGRRLTGSCKD